MNDNICPVQTARAAAAAYAAPVSLREWSDAAHEAGGSADRRAALTILRDRFGLTDPEPA